MGNSVSVFTLVSSRGYCSGCGACVGLYSRSSAAMKMSPEGFLRPYFSESEECSRPSLPAMAACTGLQMKRNFPEGHDHALWGSLIRVRTANAIDPEVQYQGSSGGAISALAIYLLQEKKVDFVAQIAVDPAAPLRNRIQMSRTRDDVLRAAGSRYAPAAPLELIDKYLSTGEVFAFIGKPCDVAALRGLARVDERVNRQVPYMISFMCAGVPSIEGTHQLLRDMGVEPEEVSQFRYRGDGWPGMARAVTRDGRVAETDYNSSWGKVLNRHLQFRCKICPDGTGEFADVVCADAWYGKDGYPDFAERDGRSLLLARTRAGEALVRAAVEAGSIEVSDLPVSEIARMQPYQVHRKSVALGRILGAFARLGHVPKFRQMGLIKASLRASPIEWLRNAVGTYKRAKGEIL